MEISFVPIATAMQRLAVGGCPTGASFPIIDLTNIPPSGFNYFTRTTPYYAISTTNPIATGYCF